MTYTIFLGGALNWVVLGLPIYLWVIFLLFITGLIIIACFYFFYWWKLTPYHGIFWAHVRKIGASLVFDENQHFDLITDRSSKVIFNETFAQAQEAEGERIESQPATLGRVRVDFVFDPDKWTYPNFDQHKIIEDVAEDWNNIHEDDQIRTLTKFSKYLSQGEFDMPHYADKIKGLKRYYTVPWWRIKAMYKQRTLDDVYGFTMSLAKIIEENTVPDFNRYWWVFLAGFGLIDLLIFAVNRMHG